MHAYSVYQLANALISNVSNLQANDKANISGKPAFTLTYDEKNKASVDIVWPGAGGSLDNQMPDYDITLENRPQGTTVEVTININNKPGRGKGKK